MSVYAKFYIYIMSKSSSNKNKILKNTLLLYVRMFVMMAVSLYTSRVVLKTLGVEDFGLYNVVGGIVVLFSILNGALTSATQRFLNYEIGREDELGINSIFQSSISLHIVLSIIVVLLSESIGLWYVNCILNVPAGRIAAANWVYQFSILVFVGNILRVPFNSCIIAYEKMDFFAYASIIEVLLKLIVVYVLLCDVGDKLVAYSILLFVVTLFITIAYVVYCNNKFKMIRIKACWDKKQMSKLLGFSGWSLFGSIAVVSNQHGVNLILNYFCGVVVNAAVGIAGQVTGALYGFVSNFQVAFNPPIVKLYAQKRYSDFFNLIISASKASYLLLFFISLPVLFMAPQILSVWLDIVPEHSVSFCRVIIIYNLLDALNGPLWIAVNATGKIKGYQLLMSIILLLNLPFAYILLFCGFDPESVWLSRLFFNVIATAARLLFLHKKLTFPLLFYIKSVILPLFVVSILSFVLFYYSSTLSTIVFQIIFYCVSLLASCFFAYIICLTKHEKNYLNKIILSKL